MYRTDKKTKMLKNNFKEAFKKSMGNITVACKQCNITRVTYYKWLKKDSKFKRDIEDIGESVTDFVESKLLKEISNENTTAIIFYLKTKGKNRGYSERIETETKEVSKFESEKVKIYIPDNGRNS